MNRAEKHLLKLVNERQRLIKYIEKLEREHRNAAEPRGRLTRITADEIRAVNRIHKRGMLA